MFCNERWLYFFGMCTQSQRGKERKFFNITSTLNSSVNYHIVDRRLFCHFLKNVFILYRERIFFKFTLALRKQKVTHPLYLAHQYPLIEWAT